MPRSVPSCEPFGTTPDGQPVEMWRLTSTTGIVAEILTYGGILHALHVPDRTGHLESVVLSLPDITNYVMHSPYFGALIGRYANRIADGRFTLDGRTHRLPLNDRGHTLHGGPDGFDRRLWLAKPLDGAVRLTLHSPHADMGFPGGLDVAATYSLDDDGTLSLTFEAISDRPTVVNLTNHAYFNLAGARNAGSGIQEHTLLLEADHYLPVSPKAIPYGPARSVAGTPFDFTRPRTIGAGITHPDPQITAAGGYDHCWILRTSTAPHVLRSAAVLHDPNSGRTLEVHTTEPGLQVYTANQLDGSLTGAHGQPYHAHAAVCLETQHLPDSPNREQYPTTVLRPGDTYRSRTEFRFPSTASTPRPLRARIPKAG